ncbi:MAG TPA: UDP-N-acetylglucosamine 2-epimerase [Burkholderiaceae bacterium]|nr:UDP-N-acetylglucosamine 2-epimerase [Burkholderiaceae bacterium]
MIRDEPPMAGPAMCVVGARPNFMKMAPILVAVKKGVAVAHVEAGVPCLTMRENTEQPITVEQGTNTMVGRDRDAILQRLAEILGGDGQRGRMPELWDGRAAERIAADLSQWLRR